jgi:hypothetical protein
MTPTPTVTPFGGFPMNGLVAFKLIGTEPFPLLFGDIWVSLPNGDNKLNITSDQPGDRKKLYGWSPDGKWIIYGRYKEMMGYELWKMKADGSEKNQFSDIFTRSDTRIFRKLANWDGDNFLDTCRTGGEETEICIVNVTESTVQKPGYSGEQPTYSPNRLAYAWFINHKMTMQMVEEESNLADLFVLRKGESSPIKLPMPKNIQIEGYTWSRDSQNIILYTRIASSRTSGGVYSIQADGLKEPEMIMNVSTNHSILSFDEASPNGIYLLFYGIDIHGSVATLDSNSEPCIINLVEKNTKCLNRGWDYFQWTPDNQLVARKDDVAYTFDLVTGEPTQTDQLNWLYSLFGAIPQP